MEKKKFFSCLLVIVFVLLACCVNNNVEAFPTHRGYYRYNELCEKVKNGDWEDFRFHVWLTLKAIELIENYRGIKIPDELKKKCAAGSIFDRFMGL